MVTAFTIHDLSVMANVLSILVFALWCTSLIKVPERFYIVTGNRRLHWTAKIQVAIALAVLVQLIAILFVSYHLITGV